MPVDLSSDLTARLSVSDFFVGRSGSHFTVRQPESNFHVGRCESNIVRMPEALFLQRMRSVPLAFDFCMSHSPGVVFHHGLLFVDHHPCSCTSVSLV